jgi:hypothetical protein
MRNRIVDSQKLSATARYQKNMKKKSFDKKFCANLI